MMMPVPVALSFVGRNAVRVGVTTFVMTVPIGVSLVEVSVWVHFSEPGATPGQRLIVWAYELPARTMDRNTP
jgi:hypothetical protein